MAEPASGASRLLRDAGLRPRKRLGQNFLRDTSFLKRIVDAAEVGPADDVLEIGAGTGVLTRAAADRAARVVAVELDDSLVALLEREFAATPQVEVLHANALEIDPADLFVTPYKLLGNIPYYITGPIIRHFLEAPHAPTVLVLMVQREVADRMTALPGRMSLLAVSVQYYAHVDVVVRVPAGAFYPRPRVDSAVVRLVPTRLPSPVPADLFFSVARAGFAMKRKQLANSLGAGLSLGRSSTSALLTAAHIDGARRAETLSIGEWEALAAAWQAQCRAESA